MVNRANRYPSPCGCGSPDRKPAAKQTAPLVKKLRAIDFSLADTVLYLDAYPHCKKALEYYKKLKAERDILSAKLSELGVPMNNMSIDGDRWTWTDSPWPWDYEANVST